jgi:aconitate hydratase 2/2-methylisocitrate dehydratase
MFAGGKRPLQRLLNRNIAHRVPFSEQARRITSFRKQYDAHVADREAQRGIPPKALTPAWAKRVCELLGGTGEPSDKPLDEKDVSFLRDLIINRCPPGVDDAARVKAEFLNNIAKGTVSSEHITREEATKLLGTMLGGYNIHPMIDLLDDPELAPIAAEGLKHTLLMFDAFHDVEEKANAGNEHAKAVMQSWADAEWFLTKPEVPEKITVTVFKVSNETNTDDLSPAPDAPSRPDIPLHALAMLKIPREGIHDAKSQIEELKEKGHPVAYVGDTVGTGSSRKSATNSVLWYMGDDIPYVPNKRTGGVCIGGIVAPIFFNTMEDACASVGDGRHEAQHGRCYRHLPVPGKDLQARH